MTPPTFTVHRGGVPSRMTRPPCADERDAQPLGPLPETCPRGVKLAPYAFYPGMWSLLAISSTGLVIDEAHVRTVGEYNDAVVQLEEVLRTRDPVPDAAEVAG